MKFENSCLSSTHFYENRSWCWWDAASLSRAFPSLCDPVGWLFPDLMDWLYRGLEVAWYWREAELLQSAERECNCDFLVFSQSMVFCRLCYLYPYILFTLWSLRCRDTPYLFIFQIPNIYKYIAFFPFWKPAAWACPWERLRSAM